MNKSKIGYLFILPFMVMFVLFTIIPTIAGMVISFTDYNGMNLSNINFIGFENYQNIFNSESIYFDDFWSAVLRTFLFVVTIVPFLIIIPLVLSQVITGLKYGKGIIKGLFYIPVILSVTGVATLAGWFFDQKYGLLNYFLSFVGFENIGWLTDTTLAFLAIGILTIWWTMGGNLIIYMAAMQGISTEMYEAADIEGASKWKKFYKITLPTIKPQLSFTFIMSVIATFNIYGQVQILTNGGPGKSTTTAALYIRDTAFGATQAAGQASAMGIIFGIMLIGITYFQFRNVLREM